MIVPLCSLEHFLLGNSFMKGNNKNTKLIVSYCSHEHFLLVNSVMKGDNKIDRTFMLTSTLFIGPTALPLKCSPTARSTFPESIYFIHSKLSKKSKKGESKKLQKKNSIISKWIRNEILSKIFLKFYETKWQTFLKINYSAKFAY